MNYILHHKNIPVIFFSTRDGFIFETGEIFNKDHLPIPLLNCEENPDSSIFREIFRKWWKGRSIPASRQNLDEALEILGNITTDALIEKCYGLSLSDQYWAKPVDSNLEWDKINFFENEFSEDVGKALFGEIVSATSEFFSLVSPDNTSDGWLKKKWIINDGKRILVKSGGNQYQQEPFNEVFASEICRRLNFNHIDYNIIKTENQYFSCCEDFINQNTELIPAWQIFNLYKKDNNTSKFQHLLDCAEKIGIKIDSAKDEMVKMFILDYIISNTDRHFNNFGFIRNADSLEWIGLAPIFDSGTSMFHDYILQILKNPLLRDSARVKAKPFSTNQKEQIKKLPIQEIIKKIDMSSLNDICNFVKELYSQNEFLEEERIDLLSVVISEKINELSSC